MVVPTSSTGSEMRRVECSTSPGSVQYITAERGAHGGTVTPQVTKTYGEISRASYVSPLPFGDIGQVGGEINFNVLLKTPPRFSPGPKPTSKV